MKNKVLSILIWTVISIIGAVAFALLGLANGETISAAWLIIAAVCTYAVAYRFYSKFIAYKIFKLNDKRATPAEVNDDGKDYVPTNKWVLFGHHFAAIAGAGPLVGPILAAQMGYLPGALWIIIGVVLAGAVQDAVILMGSMRRNGKSLGQMAKEEVGPFGGIIASIGILAIMVILLAVLALVVVKALAGSPWGVFTIAATIPIAILMGVYMRYIRPGKVLEGSIIGFILLLLALWGGQYVAENPTLAEMFTFTGGQLAVMIGIYGFVASILPVWLLLAPRDYLSSFLKIGVIFLLAAGILIVLPELHMPKISRFIDGSGPVFAGNLFPFLFITIACGSVSGFHALVSSGTTPKMIEKESHSRFIGYGGMLMESGVAIMALIAACSLHPGLYFAMNSPAAVIGTEASQAASVISTWGFQVSASEITNAAKEIGESTIMSRTGGAPTLAVGMAEIFTSFLAGAKAFWYHFAILFEALFILTTIDAGTRIGRFMLQDLVGNFYKPFAKTNNLVANIIASAIITIGWAYITYQGAIDPFGGINSLWALFGISNQMLAAIALAIATTIIIKMGKARYAWVTIIPYVFLTITTLVAACMKLFSKVPSIGFFSHAKIYQDGIDAGKVIAPATDMEVMKQIVFNDRLDAILTIIFIAIVLLMVIASFKVWYDILIKKKKAKLHESPFVPSKYPNIPIGR
ncbi:carbon starvation CstA family protein [Heyndrickxia oleronia]|jgi:carbon starvation protein|uniref:Carbon starvation CstA family protein n=1 Tax=Heyndrickxia oleronia TaxID=38875 RepID=A0AAW6SPV1_9BACI|nr:carbon starvation CstA family protein [Heyndrickxia oleronia]MCI1590008.1 carbon starvation protein A [Heyndrickxia oleronia]MCI1613366.1 carbon starvation protein A [Heyndrickxia oleronia]MCI1744726.1 carbon starvation protein A [Heyndrickxia oleronia]MCI1761315.1 carbon starvation protein A [Heyndrickxia oleronia]MCM3239184.1 carbon starvation protein A [Heyndrickxia oleronia]